VRLVGPKDRHAGIRFVREIRILPGSTTIDLRSTMESIADRPVRWGIWQVTQHRAYGTPKAPKREPLGTDLVAWAPLSPRSRHPKGYRVMFGPEDNPQFEVIEPAKGAGRLLRIAYDHAVGKVGIDAGRGWLAVTHDDGNWNITSNPDREPCHLWAQTFEAEPGKEHPDGACIEFRTSGSGKVVIDGMEETFAESEPLLLESEVLSPFFRLEPGEKATFSTRIHLGVAKGPVVDVKEAIAVLDPVHRGPRGIAGRFVVFRDGTLAVMDLSRGAPPAATIGPVKAGSEVDLGSGAAARALEGLRVGPLNADFQLALTMEGGR
jgi:hypothetical protein